MRPGIREGRGPCSGDTGELVYRVIDVYMVCFKSFQVLTISEM